MKLEQGEIICDECNGSGGYRQKPINSFLVCKKCLGSGKLNWVENIFGKRENFLIWCPPAGFKR